MSNRNRWEDHVEDEPPYVNLLPDDADRFVEPGTDFGRGYDAGYAKGYQVGWDKGVEHASRARHNEELLEEDERWP